MTVAERAPFQPKADLPEWRLIYDKLLSHAEFGDVITYEQLDEVLSRPFLENRSPIYRAGRELGAMRKRQLSAVPNVGYRIVEAREHISLSRGRKDRATRQLKHSVEVLKVTDLSRLTPAELDVLDQQMRINAGLYSMIVHVDERVTRLEEILRADGKL